MSESVEGFCPHCGADDLESYEDIIICKSCGDKVDRGKLSAQEDPFNFTGDYDAVKDYLEQSGETFE